MRMVDLIEKKRDGGVLTDEEIRFIIKGFTAGSIPDYQMSAFAMRRLQVQFCLICESHNSSEFFGSSISSHDIVFKIELLLFFWTH